MSCPHQCDLPTTNDPSQIIIHGAREHNLKNICLAIPKGKLVALIGPSGSGKSSIAIDVLGNECLRQLLESIGLTTDHISKANVDRIIGLSPAIGITQRVTDFNPRSTVGTRSGLLTILRNLFASIGHPPCSKPEKLKMAHFSPNSAIGACESCKGVGEVIGVDLPKLLNEDKTLTGGGVDLWDRATAQHYERVIQAAAQHYGHPFDTTLPLRNYSQKQRDFLLHGTAPTAVKAPKKVSEGKFEGLVPYLLTRYKSAPHKVPTAIQKYIFHEPCLECHGTRLGKIGREVTIAGKTIAEVSALSLRELLAWIEGLDQQLPEKEQQVFATLYTPLKERTSHLIEVGLDYLTLDRTLPSLSAGESQRVRLANVLGSGLTGVLYLLDEPTTGLHPHDTAKLLKTLRLIQQAGNTVLIIEHDLDLVRQVDHVIHVGPKGGRQGGQIVASGTPAQVLATSAPLLPNHPSRPPQHWLTILGASEHNLKGIDVRIPLNQLVVLTGVSGSGKSTFLFGILDKLARQHLNGASAPAGKHTSVHGLEHFSRVVTIDQVTIGKTKSSTSNVATYTKLFDSIRDLFASLPQAKARGFGPDAFSFNISDVRCEQCQGAGVVPIDMAFMPDVEIECPTCHGTRFNDALLAIQFREHNISNILDLTVSEALPLFEDHPKIASPLALMQQVGLSYLTLGQSTSTLSGGEAQRIKLARELSKSSRASTLYLLDEPTTGLHPDEVHQLLHILRKLVDGGNTVVTIEHNLDIIASADTLLDFGPGGGTAGGQLIATGTPHHLATHPHSLTGHSLHTHLLQPISAPFGVRPQMVHLGNPDELSGCQV